VSAFLPYVCVLELLLTAIALCTIVCNFLDASQLHTLDILLALCWIFKLKRFSVNTIHRYYDIYTVELSDCVRDNLYRHIP
jgi:hypothetical protein